MKYKVILLTSVKSLEEEVAQFLKEGWVPQGGVSIGVRPDFFRLVFAQAMIKED